jgi:hypothetical protein
VPRAYYFTSHASQPAGHLTLSYVKCSSLRWPRRVDRLLDDAQRAVIERLADGDQPRHQTLA